MDSLKYMEGWPDRGRGPLRIEVHLQPIDGRLECVGLLFGILKTYPTEDDVSAFLPYGKPHALKASLLRDLSLPDLIERAIASHISVLDDFASSDPSGWLAGYEDTPKWAAEMVEAIEQRPKKTGRPAHGAEHWVKVVAVYRQAHIERRPPTQAVAKAFEVNKSTAAKYVAEARKRGLLPPTTRGKPSI